MPRYPRPEPYIKTCIRIPARQKAVLEARARINDRTFTAELVEAVDRGMARELPQADQASIFGASVDGNRVTPCVHRIAAGAFCEACDAVPV